MTQTTFTGRTALRGKVLHTADMSHTPQLQGFDAVLACETTRSFSPEDGDTMFLPLVCIRHDATAQHTAILTNLRHENLTNYMSRSCLTPPPFVNGEFPQFFTPPQETIRSEGPTCRPTNKFYFVHFRALIAYFHIENRLTHTYITSLY